MCVPVFVLLLCVYVYVCVCANLPPVCAAALGHLFCTEESYTALFDLDSMGVFEALTQNPDGAIHAKCVPHCYCFVSLLGSSLC